MAWPCKLYQFVGTREITYEPAKDGSISGETVFVDAHGIEYRFDDLPIGAIFEMPQGVDTEHGWPWWGAGPNWVSDKFLAEHAATRRPYFVKLPGPGLFCIDSKCWEGERRYGGWTVTGIAPDVTMQPSINCVGTYHGWMQNGVVTDDCEGRTYGPDGRRVSNAPSP